MDSPEETIAGIVSRLKDAPGALLPILHAIQDAAWLRAAGGGAR